MRVRDNKCYCAAAHNICTSNYGFTCSSTCGDCHSKTNTALCFCPMGLLKPSLLHCPWLDRPYQLGGVMDQNVLCNTENTTLKSERRVIEEPYEGGGCRGGCERPCSSCSLGVCIIDSQKVLVQRAIDLKQVTVE